MRTTHCSVLVVLVLASACTGAEPQEPARPSAITGSTTAGPMGVAGEQPADVEPAGGGSGSLLPHPDARVPRDPARLATRLTRTMRALTEAVDRWRASGGTVEWPPPRAVMLLALDQQRIHQLLAGMDERRREATLGRVPRDLRPAARDATFAALRLAEGLAGVIVEEPIDMRTRAPLPPDALRAHYERASRRFDVPWTLLAAVHFMETKFGRVVSPSWAGAQGPMQFLPSTWEAFGMGGDIHDTRDAIHAAANYLAATGSPDDDRAALWAYNPVDYYGDAVLAYDRLMRRDVRVFYALYTWQVFVRTRSGLVQVTGPGADLGQST